MELQGMSPAGLMTNSVPEDCVSCGGRFFKQTFMFRRVSKILVGAPQDQLIPIPVFRCDDCGTPIGDMVPDEEKLASEPNKLFDSGEN
jgi:hypothetical protein